MKNERREKKRRELLLFLPMYEQNNPNALGYLADISTDGLLLFSQVPLELGREFALEIRIQDLRQALVYDDTDTAHDVIHFAARSRWIGIDPGLYRTGFMMTTLSPQAAADIQRVIANLDKISRSVVE